MQTVHHLKTWPAEFNAVRAGVKPFEHRKNDRNYKVGDLLILRKFDPEKFALEFAGLTGCAGLSYHQIKAIVADAKSWLDAGHADETGQFANIIAADRAATEGAYTGETEEREIGYVLEGGEFGVMPFHAVLGFRPARGAPAHPRGDVTPADLAAWHRAEAQKARNAAGRHREAAGMYDTPTAHSAAAIGRWNACAMAADADAAFHEGAAALIDGLPKALT